MLRILVVVAAALVLESAVASAQQPCSTDAQQVVDQIYRQVLDRPADAGSAAWAGQLTGRNATVRDLVREIGKSSESQRSFTPARRTPAAYENAIETLYQRLMNRQPDDVDRRAYAKVARISGFAAVIDDIVASPEYRRAFGDWTVPGGSGVRYCTDESQTGQVSNRPYGNRFRGMDRNNDGVITRNEWRGSLESFRVHDWNHDGVLSGDEIRSDRAQSGRDLADSNFDRSDRFDYLDVDRDGRIEWREWHGTADAFDALDRNHDNVLSRDELGANAGAVPTSGRSVIVDATERWTDTGIDVRAGDAVYFSATGTVQLSSDANDVATPDGSRTSRTAPDAPLQRQSAGALVARIGNSAPVLVGARGSIVRAPVGGRLYLTVNDDYLGDNSGQFRVTVEIRDR